MVKSDTPWCNLTSPKRKLKMKNNFELSQVNSEELNQVVELTEREMSDLAGGFIGISDCTSGGISTMPFLCPSEQCNT